MTAKWSLKSTEQIEKILNTNAACGLSRKAARVRLKRAGENRIYNMDTPGLRSYAAQMLSDLASYFLVIAAIVAAVFDFVSLSVVILCIWGVNLILTLVIYMKAEKTFCNSYYYSIPKTRVIREGRVYLTDPRNLVRGDIVLLREGDVAPADLRLCDSRDLFVLEYDEDKKETPRKKDATARILDPECTPAAEANMVFAGSVVITGEARAIVVDVGEDTYTYETIGPLSVVPPSSGFAFLNKLTGYCTAWSIFMLILILPVTLFGMKNGFFDSFMIGLALASSTVSEMIVAIGRIIIACSVKNAALIGDEKKNTAIIKNVSGAMSLSSVDTLLLLDESVFSPGETQIDAVLCYDKEEFLISTMLASNIAFSEGSLATSTVLRSSDDVALEEYCEENGFTRKKAVDRRIFAGYAPASEYNFDTVLVNEETDFFAYLKGDAARVLSRCTTYRKDGNDLPMTNEIIAEAVSFINDMRGKKRRVYAVAKKKSAYNSLARVSALQSELTYIGLIAYGDPVISSAKDVLESFILRGVDVVFASDTKNEELRALLAENSEFCTCFYTDSISEKKRIFAELKEKGKHVALVSSKVSELGMMKDADASFTVAPDEFFKNTRDTVPYLTPIEKSYGTEVSKKEADIIVKRATKNNFGIASILSVFDYTVCAIKNISDMMKYLICSAFARVLIVLFTVLFDMPLFAPSQILFCGLIVDLLAILVFSFEKPDGICKKKEVAERLEHPIKSNLFWMILGALSSATIFVIPFILSFITEKHTNAEILNYGFLSFIILQIVILIESSNDNTVFTRKIRLNVMKLLYFCLVAFSVASMFLFDAFGAYFGITHSAVALLPFSLIPGAVAFIISEICKFFSAKRKG